MAAIGNWSAAARSATACVVVAGVVGCGGGGGGAGAGAGAGGGGGGAGGGGNPPAAGAGAASECLNAALDTVGTTFRWDAQISGYANGTSTVQGSLQRRTTFEGTADVSEVEMQTTTRVAVAGTALPEEVKRTLDYSRIVGNNAVQYGKVETLLSAPALGTTRTVNTPPRTDARYGLAVGASVAITTTASATTTLPAGTTLPPAVNSGTDTVTYIGQSVITVPAGSFTACRFDVVYANGGPVTEWIAVGSGAPLRTVSAPGTPTESRFELLGSSRLNGAAL